MKMKYVSIGKPVEIAEFVVMKKPMGWYRLVFLQERLNRDMEFRKKFNKKEIDFIMKGKLGKMI